METRKFMVCESDFIDMVERYDGVYSPYWESHFEYFVKKVWTKFRNKFIAK